MYKPNWDETRRKGIHEAFPDAVVDQDVELFEMYGEEYDNTTDLVKREVSGALAADIRKRFRSEEGEEKATDADPVYITEKKWSGWISEVTAETSYQCVVNWGGYEKDFESYGDVIAFNHFIDWLDGKDDMSNIKLT